MRHQPQTLLDLTECLTFHGQKVVASALSLPFPLHPITVEQDQIVQSLMPSLNSNTGGYPVQHVTMRGIPTVQTTG